MTLRMANPNSFDVTSHVDLQEVDNALNQARKEVAQRYDFKGAKALIDFNATGSTLTLAAEDDFKLNALWEIVQTRLVRRNVPVKNLTRGTAKPAANSTVRQEIALQQGIPTEAARNIVKFVKDAKLKKVQVAIQGDQLRVSSPRKMNCSRRCSCFASRISGWDSSSATTEASVRVPAVFHRGRQDSYNRDMKDALIVTAVRTPVGRTGGALADVRADDLAALAVRAAVDRAPFDAALIDDVILGCTNQAGEDNRNVARMAALLAGFPVDVPGQTVNRLCGSGLQAVASAAQAIKAGEGDAFVAGGVESMTRAPYVMLKSGAAWNRQVPTMADSTVGWRFTNPQMKKDWTISLGMTAEKVATQYGITREAQDAFGLESQRRAVAAIEQGCFGDEIVPVTIPRRKGDPVVVDTDEHPRPDVTLDKLTKLRPAFTPEGSVTAGNASGINDGASALLLVSSDQAKGLKPLARVVATAVAGVDPSVMGIGPIPATRKVLKRAGLTLDQIDLFELNEAFAAQGLACMKELELDPAKVNVYGGAIALGHALGSSGSRILTTLVHALQRRGGRYGLATMCIGVGQGIAMIVERA